MSDEKAAPVNKKRDIKWIAVLWYIHLHFFGLYSIWLLLTSAKWMTVIYTILLTLVGWIGVTVGCHRFWAHKTFQAYGILKVFLILAQTTAGVGSIYDWVLYHRLHHKYYGTDKDPYNHKQGFLYSHYISHFMSPVVDYEQARKEIDMRDIEADFLIILQNRLYWLLFGIFGLLLPLNAPLEYWNETLTQTVLITGFLRLLITLNISWLVNSALLVWSTLDTKLITNNLSIFAISQSYWPAYHYLAPWDWKTDEFGSYDNGFSTVVIKIWRALDWIDSMRTTTTEEMREVIHALSSKKLTMEQSMEKLKEMSNSNMQLEQKKVRH